MNGRHLTADLGGCSPQNPLMTMVEPLRERCLTLVTESGLRVVGDCFHGFPAPPQHSAGGVTGMVLLAESHLAIHTWPESGAVTLDIFVCNQEKDNSAAAHQVINRLIKDFAPRRCQVQEMRRIAQN